MRARDIMSRPVTSVDTGTTVREAITALTGRGWIEALRIDPAHYILGLRLNDWVAARTGSFSGDASTRCRW
jgi:hypothetical protein